MPVSDSRQSHKFSGDGVTTRLPVGFSFGLASEIVVVSKVSATGAATTLSSPTHYSVESTDVGSTVVVVNPESNFPATVIWEVSRSTPVTQLLDLKESEAFQATSVEASLDQTVRLIQDSNSDSVNALQFPPHDPDGSSTSLLPDSKTRGSNSLGFSHEGNVIAVAGTLPSTSAGGDAVSTTSFTSEWVHSRDSGEARKNLEVTLSGIDARGKMVRGSSSNSEEGFAHPGEENRFLVATSANDTGWSEATLPVISGAGDFGKVLGVNAAGTAFELKSDVYTYDTGWKYPTTNLEGDDFEDDEAHGTVSVTSFPLAPKLVQLALECLDSYSQSGYAPGDQIVNFSTWNVLGGDSSATGSIATPGHWVFSPFWEHNAATDTLTLGYNFNAPEKISTSIGENDYSSAGILAWSSISSVSEPGVYGGAYSGALQTYLEKQAWRVALRAFA